MAVKRGASADPGAAKPFRPVLEDGQVNIRSDLAIPQQQAKALSRRVKAAYDFDLKQERWKDTAPLKDPIDVYVLSPDAFTKTLGPNLQAALAVSAGKDSILMPESVLDSGSPSANNILAHELGHIQDNRQGPNANKEIPLFLQEGKAYELGDRYSMSRGENADALWQNRRSLEQLSGAAVNEAVKKPETLVGELTGEMFVEYLRTRLHGSGDAGAVEHLAQMTAAVGHGEAFADAFRAPFGVSFEQATKSFADFLDQTQGDPKERFKGTLWDEP